MKEQKENVIALPKSSVKWLALVVVAFVVGYVVGGSFSIVPKSGTTGGTTVTQPPSTGEPSGSTQPGARVSVKLEGEPVIGSANAKVTIVEFTDYQCPFCKRAHDQTYPQIKKDYIDTGKVKYVVKDFPLPFHQAADEAALAAGCVFDQNKDKYWDFRETLFNKQDEWSAVQTPTADTFKTYVTSLGLNSATFESCFKSGKFSQEVQDDLAEGTQVGVGGTPTFYINGRELVGAQPYAAFNSMIDQELAG